MTPGYVAHGATLTLAWFVAINALTSAAVALAAAATGRAGHGRRSPRFWISLRLAPACLAGLFAAALFVPSYLKYEPRQTVEGFDITLTALALGGIAIGAVALARMINAWLAARRRVAGWLHHARAIRLPGTTLPAFLVESPQPFIALAGIFRPMLLATRGLLDSLTEVELEAVVAHEAAHHRSLDNLKRLVMRGTPDMLALTPASSLLERRWAAAAEHDADRIGGHDCPAARCALASALVKVARLTSAAAPITEPISAFISGGEIASRVQSLLGDDAPGRNRRVRGYALPVAALALIATFAYLPMLHLVHELTEVLVRSLP